METRVKKTPTAQSRGPIVRAYGTILALYLQISGTREMPSIAKWVAFAARQTVDGYVYRGVNQGVGILSVLGG